MKKQQDLIAWTIPEESSAQWISAVWLQKGDLLTPSYHRDLMIFQVQSMIDKAEDPQEAVWMLERGLEEADLYPDGMLSPKKTETAAEELMSYLINERLYHHLSLLGIHDDLPAGPIMETDPKAEEILEQMDLKTWIENL